MDGQFNPANVLSKHFGFVEAWPTLRQLLVWRGDTGNIKENEVRT